MFLPGLSGTRTFGSSTSRIVVVSVSRPVRSTGASLIPLLELHDDLDALLLAHGAHAEDRRDVDETDAANLHVMTLQLVAAADQHVAAAPASRSRDRRRRDDGRARRGRARTPICRCRSARRTTVRRRRRRRASRAAFVVGANSSSSHGLMPRVELVRLEPRADQRDARGSPRARPDRRRRLLPLRDEHAGNRKRKERRRDGVGERRGSSDLRYVISVSPST